MVVKDGVPNLFNGCEGCLEYGEMFWFVERNISYFIK